ncbi:hypothetical protein HAX54_001771 [Datura stramonium]|uniref:C3H1-type domain-containing protein n=1 Tax=Datura stramonium TaxID=4076 RepID=A0ABS8T417_DATST|nr:hypothetical protein [Datura stramonium]
MAVQLNRCSICRKKLGLTEFKCKCGTHQYLEIHGCSFDFKSMGRDAIAKMVVAVANVFALIFGFLDCSASILRGLNLPSPLSITRADDPSGALGRKPCLYFSRGYCKNGSYYRFFHGAGPLELGSGVEGQDRGRCRVGGWGRVLKVKVKFEGQGRVSSRGSGSEVCSGLGLTQRLGMSFRSLVGVSYRVRARGRKSIWGSVLSRVSGSGLRVKVGCWGRCRVKGRGRKFGLGRGSGLEVVSGVDAKSQDGDRGRMSSQKSGSGVEVGDRGWLSGWGRS